MVYKVERQIQHFACGRCAGTLWSLYPDGTVVCAVANCKLVADDLRVSLRNEIRPRSKKEAERDE